MGGQEGKEEDRRYRSPDRWLPAAAVLVPTKELARSGCHTPPTCPEVDPHLPCLCVSVCVCLCLCRQFAAMALPLLEQLQLQGYQIHLGQVALPFP